MFDEGYFKKSNDFEKKENPYIDLVASALNKSYTDAVNENFEYLEIKYGDRFEVIE